jgi:hypothetical protein
VKLDRGMSGIRAHLSELVAAVRRAGVLRA